MRLASRIGAIEVQDPTGAPRRLGEFWKRQPVVLVFVRHFG